eukprot:Skav234692  [mRNA]  locus=scaffold3643:162728:163535:- [translate_table: standard]
MERSRHRSRFARPMTACLGAAIGGSCFAGFGLVQRSQGLVDGRRLAAPNWRPGRPSRIPVASEARGSSVNRGFPCEVLAAAFHFM